MTERELNEMIERYEGSREIGIDFPSRGPKGVKRNDST